MKQKGGDICPGTKPLGMFPTGIKVRSLDTMQVSSRNGGRRREGGSRRKVKMLSITEIMSHALQDDQPERIQHYRGGISPILGFGNQKNKTTVSHLQSCNFTMM